SAPKSEVMQSIGAEFEELSKDEAEKFDINGGLKIKRMYAGTLRAQTGIREGFIITKVNKEPINTVKELERILESEKGGVLIEGINPESGKKEYYGFGM
ncbi:MAG: PDZ domain-containing protein, partial [Flammeovirgaceae bacterium]|nr:PDZ domain-containing protein [Flammeovirgaceae bacterium]